MRSHQRRVLVRCSLGSWLSVTQLAESSFGLHSKSKCYLIQQLCFKHDELHLDYSLWGCIDFSTTCLMDTCTKSTPHCFRIHWACFAIESQSTAETTSLKITWVNFLSLGQEHIYTCLSWCEVIRIFSQQIFPQADCGGLCPCACMVITLMISF